MMSQREQKAPMLQMPIMKKPFERIAMDVVGPLPTSSTGKQYVLVIFDYFTTCRYPAAYALRRITAVQVLEKLMEFFAENGVPKEILTDQGTNFTSALLRELYTMLRVQGIQTSPYHPQTDGMVERYNQTLKLMLRKTADEEKRNRDKLIPLDLQHFLPPSQAQSVGSPLAVLTEHQHFYSEAPDSAVL